VRHLDCRVSTYAICVALFDRRRDSPSGYDRDHAVSKATADTDPTLFFLVSSSNSRVAASF
jgi:hypothetical protein